MLRRIVAVWMTLTATLQILLAAAVLVDDLIGQVWSAGRESFRAVALSVGLILAAPVIAAGGLLLYRGLRADLVRGIATAVLLLGGLQLFTPPFAGLGAAVILGATGALFTAWSVGPEPEPAPEEAAPASTARKAPYDRTERLLIGIIVLSALGLLSGMIWGWLEG